MNNFTSKKKSITRRVSKEWFLDNQKIEYWHVNKLKGSSQSGLIPVKDRNGATISDKEKLKKDGWNILRMC